MLLINIIFDVFIEHIIILFSHLQWEIYCKKDLITPLRRFYFNSHTLNVLNYTYIFCAISRKEGFFVETRQLNRVNVIRWIQHNVIFINIIGYAIESFYFTFYQRKLHNFLHINYPFHLSNFNQFVSFVRM